MTSDETALQRVGELYAGKPVVRALLELVKSVPIVGGVVGALDELLIQKIADIREDRLRTLLDKLASGEVILTPEIVQQEPFLHAYFATAKAALDTQDREKIEHFAWLLLNGTKHGLIYGDTHEEYLSILRELSKRKMQLLVICHGLGFSARALAAKAGVDLPDDNYRSWPELQQRARFAGHIA